MSRDDPFKYASPPVWEIGISAVTAAPILDVYDVRLLHDVFRTDLPRVERQPPIGPMNPFPAGPGPVVPTVMPVFQIGPEPIRWWFVSENGDHVAQFQEQFLARNWRRQVLSRDAIEEYPGFAGVLEGFKSQLTNLDKFNASRGTGPAEPTVIELLYDNLLPLDSDKGRLKLSDVLSHMTGVHKEPIHGFNMGWLERIPGENPTGPLTLQVSMSAVGAPTGPKGENRGYLKMTFTARAPKSNWREAFEFLEHAHARLRERLIDLTTETYRATW